MTSIRYVLIQKSFASIVWIMESIITNSITNCVVRN